MPFIYVEKVTLLFVMSEHFSMTSVTVFCPYFLLPSLTAGYTVPTKYTFVPQIDLNYKYFQLTLCFMSSLHFLKDLNEGHEHVF